MGQLQKRMKRWKEREDVAIGRVAVAVPCVRVSFLPSRLSFLTEPLRRTMMSARRRAPGWLGGRSNTPSTSVTKTAMISFDPTMSLSIPADNINRIFHAFQEIYSKGNLPAFSGGWVAWSTFSQSHSRILSPPKIVQR